MSYPTNSDFDSIVTWQDALDLIKRLCGNQADVSYGDRLIGTYRLPTLEIRLDDPASLVLPHVRDELHHWPNAVISFDPSQGHKDAICLKPREAAACVYDTFVSFVKLLTDLGNQLDQSSFQWAWCSIPIATFCDDPSLYRQRVESSLAFGGVSSIWLRQQDEAIKALLPTLSGCGQVRLHNLTSSNTFVAGQEDEQRLIKALGL